MEPFIKLTGVIAPMDRVNVDTDQIIPAVYLKSIKRDGFGEALFAAWRYNADGTPNPDFVLNQPAYRNAKVLVAGPNFGCGSSREHAPWALRDYGIRCIIASSFADIFYSNSFQNGLLPLKLPEDAVRKIMDHVKAHPGVELNVDLQALRVWSDDEEIVVEFELDPFRRQCLLEGLDDIGLTLKVEDNIAAFEARRGG